MVKLRNQQNLAAVLVGSVLVVFCGIVAYQIVQIALQFKAMRRINDALHTKLRILVRRQQNVTVLLPKAAGGEANSAAAAAAATVKTTHTVISLRDDEVREPLLTEN